MNLSKYDEFLRAEHLQGKRVTVEIEKVVERDIYSKRAKKKIPTPVVYFVGRKVGLVLSDFNRRTLMRLFGVESDNFKGQKIALEAVRMEVAGEPQYPIRITEVEQKATTPAVQKPEQAAPARVN